MPHFNPRTRMGCDSKRMVKKGKAPDFNPRTRMGCDIKINPVPNQVQDFNPRTRMGCDYVLSVYLLVRFISIHAPAWGATK